MHERWGGFGKEGHVTLYGKKIFAKQCHLTIECACVSCVLCGDTSMTCNFTNGVPDKMEHINTVHTSAY